MIHTWHRLGCTYDIHVCTCLIVVHNKNMEKHSVLSVMPEVYNFILACAEQCTQKRENATGKLPTCPGHFKSVYACLNSV